MKFSLRISPFFPAVAGVADPGRHYPVIQMILLVMLLSIALAPCLRADGGWVCWRGNEGPYRFTVFANPAPLRAGPVDFSVMVQDGASGRAITDAELLLTVSPNFVIETGKDGEWLPPCCRLEANTFEGKAILGAGGNGLLYETRMSLPQPGAWKMELSVDRSGEKIVASGMIQVEKAAPPWSVYWGYLAFPGAGLLFMGLNWLARNSRMPSGAR